MHICCRDKLLSDIFDKLNVEVYVCINSKKIWIFSYQKNIC